MCLCQVYNCISAALTLEPQITLNTFINMIFCKFCVLFKVYEVHSWFKLLGLLQADVKKCDLIFID